jgi:hypothetical protein
MRAVFIILLILISYGCIWENEESLFPDSELCDTLDVSYDEDVIPILVNNCYACHSNANAPAFGSGLALEDHADVSASAPLMLGAIKHSDGFVAMPKDADQLDSCSIATVEAWINSGSPDN